jgi:hypothetical protein
MKSISKIQDASRGGTNLHFGPPESRSRFHKAVAHTHEYSCLEGQSLNTTSAALLMLLILSSRALICPSLVCPCLSYSQVNSPMIHPQAYRGIKDGFPVVRTSFAEKASHFDEML